MISIPVAVANEFFRWQLDLFWYNHKLVYGDLAEKKAVAIVINKHDVTDTKIDRLDWNIGVPYRLCDSFYDYLGIDYEYGILKPLNIQIGLAQIIDQFDDEEVIEIIDCDQFHLSPYPEFHINDDEIIVSDVYEDWHLKSLSNNRHVIEKYFLNDGNYYNGGYEPIVGKVKTFKKLLNDWIYIHKDIVDDKNNDGLIHWWGGMFALSAACERNKINMIAKDTCYIPRLNALLPSHYCCHYSVDSQFDKRRFPHLNPDEFEDNRFYQVVKEWLKTYK